MVAPLQIVQPGMTRTRKRRRPSFDLAGTIRPFGLYPMWATPVLPGETLSKVDVKYRLLSMPIKHPFFGAWFETWMVYVPLTSIDEALAQMFISEDVPTTGFTAASDRPRYFTKSGQIDYVKLATDRFVQHFFRDEEEPGWSTHLIDTDIHVLRRQSMDWAQNLAFVPENMDVTALPSELPEDGTLTPLEIMRLSGMSEVTYEKYLQQYGVSKKAAEKSASLPEVLRYTREWTTPVNQIEPSTGKPSSAWSWGGNISADKNKRFDEPGFVIMYGCMRPKLLDSQLAASMVGELWGFKDFFPVYNLDDPAAGLRVLDPANKVLVRSGAGQDEPLLYDHRDLLAHGEQFVNDWTNGYPLPAMGVRDLDDTATYPGLRGWYPTSAVADSLFVGGAGVYNGCIYEGLASCEIVGHVVDTTR